MKLPVTYALFAILATLANIGAQDVVTRLNTGTFNVLASLAVGTIVGLLVKYTLDKRYIFQFSARNLRHEGATLFLYSASGILTTAVFWAFELTFHHVFETREMRYVGGAIGLAFGYLTKYQLDRKYVFDQERR